MQSSDRSEAEGPRAINERERERRTETETETDRENVNGPEGLGGSEAESGP